MFQISYVYLLILHTFQGIPYTQKIFSENCGAVPIDKEIKDITFYMLYFRSSEDHFKFNMQNPTPLNQVFILVWPLSS